MENLSNLDQAIQILESRCEGLIVAEEQPDGKMKYTVTNETACYGLYSTGAKLHAVNFSCIRSASSRLYVDWEATRKDLYADNNVSKQHVSMIRKFIKTVMNMLEQMGITRHIAWVVENRTRFNPGLGKWKPSFHIFADLWFPNNYEMMPVFVKEAMAKAKLPCHWIDFSVYQMKSLLRMIGVSSKLYHTLPRAEEDVFPMCITASLSEMPDVTAEHMEKLDMEWMPHVTDLEHTQSAGDPAILKSRILQLLSEHGERVTSLTRASKQDSFYGDNTLGRNCLTHPEQTHRVGGNRCIVWLNNEQVFYRCLDPEHNSKTLYLGNFLTETHSD